MQTISESIQKSYESDHIPYVAVYSVRTGFQFSKQFQTSDVVGLLCCQVTATNSARDMVYTFWQDEDRHKIGSGVFYERLVHVGSDPQKLFAGHQRQTRINKLKVPAYKLVFSWSFLVKLAAAWGVLAALANYFDSFSDWALAIPNTTSIVDEGKSVELLENQETPHKFVFRNDSRGGETLLKVHRIYLTPADSTQQEFDMKIAKNLEFQGQVPGSIVEVNGTFPRLKSGNYRIHAEISIRNGWIHRIYSNGRRSIEMGHADVSPLIKMIGPEIADAPSSSDPEKSTKFAKTGFIAGLRGPGIQGRVRLKWPGVRVTSILGAIPESVKPMNFMVGTVDESGLTWKTDPVKAREPIQLWIELEGPHSLSKEQWVEIMKHLDIKFQFIQGA